MKLKGEQLDRFKKYVTSGRLIVAVRTASHAVQTWLEFDREVLGGNYQNHHAVGPVTKIDVLGDARKHPILAGVELTTAPESLYKNSGHAQDIQVLLNGTIPDQPTELDRLDSRPQRRPCLLHVTGRRPRPGATGVSPDDYECSLLDGKSRSRGQDAQGDV